MITGFSNEYEILIPKFEKNFLSFLVSKVGAKVREERTKIKLDDSAFTITELSKCSSDFDEIW